MLFCAVFIRISVRFCVIHIPFTPPLFHCIFPWGGPELRETRGKQALRFERNKIIWLPEVFLISNFFIITRQKLVQIYESQSLSFNLRNRPVPVFFSAFNVYQLGKICRHHWKESLNFSKFAKFDKVFDKAPQSRENLQTFVWWGLVVPPQ